MPDRRIAPAVALIALATAWNAGNVGPVASEIAAEFDLSLATVGVLSGTLFFGSAIFGLLAAAHVSHRLGVVGALRLACVLTLLANVLLAVSPWFSGLAAGRLVAGIAFALGSALGAVFARSAGGIRMLGVFGASIQLGIAAALAVGSVLADLGVDWRVGFALSAVLGGIAYVALPDHDARGHPARSSRGFLRMALRHARVYRLAVLFVAVYGIPMLLGAWLVEYLVRDGDLAKGLAGALAFLAFGVIAGSRFLGARLRARGMSHVELVAMLGLAAVGLAGLALEPSPVVAIASLLFIGVGLGAPYGTMMDETQRLFPRDPAQPVVLMTMCGRVAPAVAIPAVGHALERSEGMLAIGLVAAFAALAMALNLRPSGEPLEETD